MGYKKGRILGTDDGLFFGKYRIARYHEKVLKFGAGCVVFFHLANRRKNGWDLTYDSPVGTSLNSELHRITLNLDTRSIFAESTMNDEEKTPIVKKMENITNKEFFNYVRSHMEKLFSKLYDVNPNEDRTSFEFIKKIEI